MAVGAQVGDAGVEMAPFAAGIAQAHRESGGLGRGGHLLQQRAVLIVQEARSPAPSRSSSGRPTLAASERLA